MIYANYQLLRNPLVPQNPLPIIRYVSVTSRACRLSVFKIISTRAAVGFESSTFELVVQGIANVKGNPSQGSKRSGVHLHGGHGS